MERTTTNRRCSIYNVVPTASEAGREDELSALLPISGMSSLLDTLPPQLRATITGYSAPILQEGCRSLLLIGPSGFGCASVARSVAHNLGCNCFSVRCEDLYAADSITTTERCTRDWGQRAVVEVIMRAAHSRRPCVLVLEDLHLMTPAPQAGHQEQTEASAGIAQGLVRALGELCGHHAGRRRPRRGAAGARLLVVGCCHSAAQVDSAVLASFGEQVLLPLPGAEERRAAVLREWRGQHGSLGGIPGSSPNPSPAQLQQLSVLADALAGLPMLPLLARAQDGVRDLVRSRRGEAEGDEGSAAGSLQGLQAVAGLQEVKRVLTETVLWPRRYAHVFKAFRKEDGAQGAPGLSSGILLFGPPGTGKTLLPRALSQELRCGLVNIRLSDVVRGEVGSSEQMLRELFLEARRAAPSVVFIDEFQALFTRRDDGGQGSGGSGSTLSAALAGCFDDLALWNSHAGASAQVVVIAATNEPWAVDGSFVRPGRLDQCVFVGPLDLAGREEFLRAHLQGAGTEMEGLVGAAAARTEGFTGADLTLLCSRSCALVASGRGLGLGLELGPALEAALSRTQPSASAQDLRAYELWWRAQQRHVSGTISTAGDIA